MYTEFASIYDELMGDVSYREWALFYQKLMIAYGVPSGGKVCECACGTGNLTLPLQRLGYHLTGVDLSQDMLWIASQKARKEGVAIPFVRQDMRQLRLHRPMDAILATCDGVNYLMTDEDVLAFFQSAYQALRPGGGLFFDVSTPDKLRHTLGDRLLWEDNDHITYLWQNSFNEQTAVCTMHLCFFVKQKDGSYQRVDEHQKQRAHEAEHLAALLRQVGFERVAVYGNNRLTAPAEGEQRWHFAALRPQDGPAE